MPNTKKNGFTIIEALVAITILLLGVLGPLSTATRGITDGLIAKNKIVALSLAQEGIELVRTKVRNNLNQGYSWLAGLDPTCLTTATSAHVCSVDVSINSYEECVSGGCNLYSGSDGIYLLGSGPGQIFSREIKIEKSSGVGPAGVSMASIETKVTVTVGWQDKSQHRDVNLSAYVYNKPD